MKCIDCKQEAHADEYPEWMQERIAKKGKDPKRCAECTAKALFEFAMADDADEGDGAP